MQVLRVNEMDFRKTHDFCDYVALMDEQPQSVVLELLDSAGHEKEFRISRVNVDFNR
jgi:hypothetical protein